MFRRELLQRDEQLKEWGVEPSLIGSYSRRTGIYPGKDVDIFLRFTSLDTQAEPRAVFDAVWRVIVQKYGQYGQGNGRAQQQARSVKVRFPDPGGPPGAPGDFSIDAVPAVGNGELRAIPTKDQYRWIVGEGRWITTGAVLFGELSEDLNQCAHYTNGWGSPRLQTHGETNSPDSGGPPWRQASRRPLFGVPNLRGMAGRTSFWR